MSIGNAERLEYALDAAILAEAAMQRVEAHVGAELGEPGRHVAGDVEAGRAVALCLERRGAGLARAQRHFPFRRPAAHQHGDVGLCVVHASSPEAEGVKPKLMRPPLTQASATRGGGYWITCFGMTRHAWT